MNTLKFLFVSLVTISACSGLERYHPFGATSSLSTSLADGAFHSIKSEDRVFLPGLRSRPAELLQLTLEQRYGRTLASEPGRLRNQAVPKIFSDGPSFARARGIYAEFWYVNQNPHIGFIRSRNDPQYDAYTRPRSQRKIGIQIKTLSGGPAAYASAMLKDHDAPQFVIPNDHVQAVRDHWKNVGDQLQQSGQLEEAKHAYRQFRRVRGLGITMAELEVEMRAGGRHLLRESSARYVSYGAAMALTIVPAVIQTMEDGYFSDKHMLIAGHWLALAGTANGMNYALSRVRNGALRGGLRGNALTGVALLVVDTTFTVHEFGGYSALSDPKFYERAGGSIGASTAGLTVGSIVGAWTTGVVASSGIGLPLAVPVGAIAGLLSGTAAGIAGHIGGTNATRWTLGLFAKEMIIKHDLKTATSARIELDRKIAHLKEFPSLNYD